MRIRNILFTIVTIFIAGGAGQVRAQSTADGFHADVNGSVSHVLTDWVGRTYIGAPNFTTVNGVTRNRLARLNRDGSLDTAYNPAPNSGVQGFAFTPNGNLVVIGGFTAIGGGASGGIARLNFDGTNDGTLTAAVSGAAAVAVEPTGKMIVGGHFTDVSGTPRNRLARFLANGTLDPTFNPNINNAVFGVSLQPDGKIIITGQFTSVNGQARWSLARLNADGSLDTTFGVNAAYPGAGGPAYNAAVQMDGKIVVSGEFVRFGDANAVRNNIARVNANGSVDSSFNPSLNAAATNAAIQHDGKIIVSGGFTTVNGATRERMVRLNMDGSVDTGFVGAANDFVNDVSVMNDGKLAIVGSFTMINGFPNNNRIAVLYPDGRLDQDTNTTVLGGPIADMVSLPDGKTLIGGSFTSVGGAGRQSMARIGWSGGNDSSFANPQFNNWVYSMGVQQDGKYMVGGGFTTVGGNPQKALARLNTNGTMDGTFAPVFANGASDPWVGSVLMQPDGKILAGGQFTTVNGVSKTRLVRLTNVGAIDNTFNASADLYVDCMALQPDGKIIIGGAFETVNGAARFAIARLNADGSLDSAFNPILGNFTAEVMDIKLLADGKILIGGTFTTVNGGARNRIARLNSDGTPDASFFNENIDGAVQAITVDTNGYIYIAGSFTTVGLPHAYIAKLNSSGAVNSLFQNTSANEKILSMTIRSDGKILVGGYFTSIGGQARGQFAVLRYANGPVYSFQPNPTHLNWYRSGYTANVSRVVFERSTDGVNYVPLGSATFTPQGWWSLATPNANANGYIRARGYYDLSDRKSVHEVVYYIATPPPATPTHRAPFDFDGDDKTDVGIFRPAVGEWWYQRSSNGQVPAFQFGSSTDKIVPGDFTGDGKADIAFWRPSTGQWFIMRSEDNSFYAFPFGANGDVPIPADYDADGKADAAVFRPSKSTWFVQRSGDGGTTIVQFGTTGDLPIVADYDGDGKADIAIFRPGPGEWWLQRSTAGTLAFQFGSSTDKLVQGDYTGDGKADAAFFRLSTGTWSILRSENLSYYSVPFGTNGDTVAPGDYDGDGRFDTTVFRPSNSTWFIDRTTAGTQIIQFGANGDRPIPNAFVP